MGNINLKKRNICLLIAIVSIGLIFIYERHGNRPTTWFGQVQILLGWSSSQHVCHRHLQWLSKDFTAPASNRVGHDSIKPIGSQSVLTFDWGKGLGGGGGSGKGF